MTQHACVVGMSLSCVSNCYSCTTYDLARDLFVFVSHGGLVGGLRSVFKKNSPCISVTFELFFILFFLVKEKAADIPT